MVNGESFWSDTAGTKIRQTQWVAYDEGDEEARMAVRLEWLSGSESKLLIKQDLYVAVAPAPNTNIARQSKYRRSADEIDPPMMTPSG